MSLLPMPDSSGGLRDALLQAVIARNYGCTHCLVGSETRNNGYPANENNSVAHSEPSERMADTVVLCREIGVELLAYEQMVYLPFEDTYCPADQVPAGARSVVLSGNDIRSRIRSGRRIPEWASFRRWWPN